MKKTTLTIPLNPPVGDTSEVTVPAYRHESGLLIHKAPDGDGRTISHNSGRRVELPWTTTPREATAICDLLSSYDIDWHKDACLFGAPEYAVVRRVWSEWWER